MPPVLASPTSRECGDAGGPGHDKAMRDSWHMTGRCSMQLPESRKPSKQRILIFYSYEKYPPS
eukprot:4766494-Prymnesium_polylepis.2